jgi:hypothetical protein
MVGAGTCMAWIGVRSVVPSEPRMCSASFRGVGLGDLLLAVILRDFSGREREEFGRQYHRPVDARHDPPLNLSLTSVTWAHWEKITLAQTATDLVGATGFDPVTPRL